MTRRCPKLRHFAAIVIIGIQTALLAWGALRQSPTYDEPAHLVAGISYWELGRFSVYRVNPPLTRLVAALPVIIAGPKTDWKSFTELPGERPEFEIGQDFIAGNGERSLWLITLARWASIPFSWLGAWICYQWSNELGGGHAGLLALLLWCFSPNILAHGQLITADIGAAAVGVAASYQFWRWLKSSSWTGAIGSGTLLGIAVLTKFTWLLLFFLWPALWIVSQLMPSAPDTLLRRVQGFQLAILLTVGVLTINLGYGFAGTFQRLGDYHFVSETLSSNRSSAGSSADEVSNKFSRGRLHNLPVPFPSDLIVGLDLQKREFEHSSRPVYLSGVFNDHGWWYYYAYAAAIKIPLGTWFFAILALAATVAPRGEAPESRGRVVVLASFLAVLLLASVQSRVNAQFRYILPCLPLAFIWMASAVRRPMRLVGDRWRNLLVAFAVVWSVSSSVWIYPHSLSFFNEVVGGPEGGSRHLLDSNIDWGQDLLFLRNWLATHPNAERLNLIYYGYFNPAEIGFGYRFPKSCASRTKTSGAVAVIEPGWYAVSENLLRGLPAAVPSQDGTWSIPDATLISEFRRHRPAAKAGYSISIFDFSIATVSATDQNHP